MDVPDYPRPLLLTDAAINIAPTLDGEGRHRAERDRPCACHRHRPTARGHPRRGRDRQRPDALDASTPRRCARWPIADRSPAALLDGPLAFDNAINEAAAAEKGIVSQVAGRADILRGSRSRSRQHAGQAAHLPRRGGGGRRGAGRACADHPDQPRRQREHPPGVLRAGGTDGAGRPRHERDRIDPHA